ncbi:MAG TPA: glycosyl hydrolase family 28 protein [Opitutaceae bacterium]|nr:glycosyl hydrolase family 28 protein [Opitutaceae bacterium]
MNVAAGGRSSMSFTKEGRWEKALALKGDYYLLQFGHNNEPGKPGRSTDMPTFVADMTRYVDEVRAAGAKPILVTPLVRRKWDPADDHRIVSSLAPYAEEVRKIAAAKNVPLIELHDRSKALCEKLGREACLAYGPTKEADGKQVPDFTHLNAEGSVLIARLVVDELRRVAPELAEYLRAEPIAAPADSSAPATADELTEHSWGGEPIAPLRAPFPMPELKRPVFPARVVDVREHGAVPGGEVKNTAAFAAAIRACSEAGGGRVLVPAGRWLTGPIHLRSRIELHLAEGAEVVFSDKFEDYLPPVFVRVGGIECFNYSPLIYARGCTDIAITGPGRLNGNAQAWWAWKSRESRVLFEAGASGLPLEQRVYGTEEAAIRPNFVSFVECNRVLLEGFTIGSGPNWTIHPVYCEDVIIRRVHVLTDGPNNDGIDPDSCRNVLVEHCVFDTGDDCLVLKSGYNEDGWRVGRPTENVVMRWCSSKRGHGGLVIGSEMSGDVRNVYMHDCEFEGTDRAVRIKSKRGRGGVVENIWAENIRVKDLRYEVVILNMDYSSDQRRLTNQRAPLFRNITVRNVTGDGAPAAVRIVGLPDSPIQNVRFENVTVASTRGVIAAHVRNLRFDGVVVTPQQGPVFDLSDARDVLVLGGKAPAGTDVFLKLAGRDSGGIVLEAGDFAAAKQIFSTASDVPADAVSVR